MTIPDPYELVDLPVPRRLYSQLVQALATALAAEGSTGATVKHAPGFWTEQEIAQLRRLVQNKTVRILMDLTCASPDGRVSFQDVRERAGRTYHEARADLAGFTKLIRANFNRSDWPLAVVQSGGEGLMYSATGSVARAWNTEGDKQTSNNSTER